MQLTSALSNLKYWLGDRAAGWAFVAFLAIVALASARLATQSKNAAAAPQAAAQNVTPDFIITGLTAHRFDSQQSSKSLLLADKFTHFNNKTALIEKPDFRSEQIAKNISLNVTAAQANLINDGEQIDFAGNVQLNRAAPARAPLALNAETLSVLPDAQQARSQSATLAAQGANNFNANKGFTLDNAQGVLQLNGRASVELKREKR